MSPSKLKIAYAGKSELWLHMAVLLVLVVATYFHSLENGFNIDDAQLVKNNTAVHGFTVANIRQMFTTVSNGLEYLPVRDITYALDFTVFGPNPSGFHFSNLIYYFIACAALYLFLRRMFVRWSIPGGTALLAVSLYALHPMHVESVAGIAQRKDLVSGLLFFLSLHQFLLYKEQGNVVRYITSFLLFLLALFGKATVISLPFLILTLDFFADDFRETFDRKLLRASPYVAASTLYSIIQSRIFAANDVLINAFDSTFFERLATAAEAVFFYLKMLVVPYPLFIYRTFDIERQPLGLVAIASFVGTALLLWLAFRFRSRNPLLSFCIFWFLITLVPVVGLVPSGTIVADRYLFLPSASYCVAASYGVFKISDLPKGRIIAVSFVLLLVSSYFWISFQRIPDWKDSLTLFHANIRQGSRDPFHYWIVGRAYYNRGNYNEAFGYFEVAKKLHSPYATDYAVLKAYYFIKKDDVATAVAWLESINRPDKLDILDVAYLYGVVAAINGDTVKSREYYDRALEGKTQLRIFSRHDVNRAVGLLGGLQ
ncbi:MAG: hypothetical protein HYS23_06100 [Geobacter sp.]|nr:hypothetical protein [Geobacter sp.]